MAQCVPGNGLDAAGRGGFDPTASAGLFVGVSNFEDERIIGVPYAVDDAVDLAHLFAIELGLVAPSCTTLLLAGTPQKTETAARLEALRGAAMGNGVVFTAAVLDGLQGGAAPGPSGWITVGTLPSSFKSRWSPGYEANGRATPKSLSGSGGESKARRRACRSFPIRAPCSKRERYRERRTKALARVRELQGELLSGAHRDQVRALLPPEEPNAEAEKLLEEIEALDGSLQSHVGCGIISVRWRATAEVSDLASPGTAKRARGAFSPRG